MQKKPLENFLLSRYNLYTTLFSIILGAIATNFIASFVWDNAGEYKFALFLLAVIILIGLANGGLKALENEMTHKKIIDLVIPYDQETKRVLEIPNYEFSSDLSDILNGIFEENPAFLKSWEQDGPTKCLEFDENESITRIRECYGANLLREAIEYMVLDDISTHLTDYFNKTNNAAIKRYSREELSGLVLSNRVLSLISTPPNDRIAFHGNGFSKRDDDIVAVYIPSGARFSKFDLTLPIGSEVSKNADVILIENERYIIKIKINYSGTEAGFNYDFAKYIYGDGFIERLRFLNASIEIEFNIKRSSLSIIRNWDDHAWIEAILDKLESNYSIKNYFERIKWDQFFLYTEASKNDYKLTLKNNPNVN